MTDEPIIVRCAKCKMALLNAVESEAIMGLPPKIQVQATNKLIEEHVEATSCDATVPQGTQLPPGEVARVFFEIFTAENVMKEIERITGLAIPPDHPEDKLMSTSVALLIMGLDISYNVGFSPRSAVDIATKMHIDMIRRRREEAEKRYAQGFTVENEVPSSKEKMS